MAPRVRKQEDQINFSVDAPATPGVWHRFSVNVMLTDEGELVAEQFSMVQIEEE